MLDSSETLGLRPFDLEVRARRSATQGAAAWPELHNPLHRAAADLFEDVGRTPEALVPLMTRTIENEFELTGPISRGDWETVEAHLDREAGRRRPDLEPLYRALADATAALVVR